MAEKARVALIGAGLMGRGIGRNLLRAGFPLAVRDADPGAVSKLVDLRARPVETVAEAAAHAFVVTCLPSLAAIEAVYDELIPNTEPGSILIDCSTSDPALTRALGAKAAARGAHLLDAPMLMGPQAAWDGTLRLVVGGDAAAIEASRPLFDAIAEDVILAGELGNAHAMKLVNNSVVMGNHVVLCEAFTVARKAGLDLEAVVRVLNGSRAASRKLDELAPRLIHDDHSLHFALDTAGKDVRLFNRFAGDMEVPVQAANAVRNVFQLTSALGHGEANVSRIATVLAQLAGTEFPKKGEG